jgi:Holliday junction resolvase RusA-like endonuclease
MAFHQMDQSRVESDFKTTAGLDANTANKRVVSFFVNGTPAPGGSKSAFPFRRKSGKMGAIVVDAGGKKTKEWRKRVTLVAKTEMRKHAILHGPLQARFAFYIKRPQSHMNAKGLKKDAPLYPAVRPDCTKLVRSTEDAMTGIVYEDDAQIVRQSALKNYVSTEAQAGCYIQIENLDPNLLK